MSIRGFLGDVATDLLFQSIGSRLSGGAFTDVSIGSAVLGSLIPTEAISRIFKGVKWSVKGEKVAGGGFLRVLKGAKQHEIDSARHIAGKLGARVLHRGDAPGPDLVIADKLWELKRLQGFSKSTIDNNIETALHNWKVAKLSANRMIIDGRDVGLTADMIRQGLGSARRERLKKVGEIKFILGNGEIIEWVL